MASNVHQEFQVQGIGEKRDNKHKEQKVIQCQLAKSKKGLWAK
jgi:hypothetical protein